MIAVFEPCLRHGYKIKRKGVVAFEPGLNVVVGPNGSGKTTLLRAIASCPDCRREESGTTEYRYHDGEALNPHVNPRAIGGSAGMILRSRAVFSSHGELMRAVLSGFRFSPGDCLLIESRKPGRTCRGRLKCANNSIFRPAVAPRL